MARNAAWSRQSLCRADTCKRRGKMRRQSTRGWWGSARRGGWCASTCTCTYRTGPHSFASLATMSNKDWDRPHRSSVSVSVRARWFLCTLPFLRQVFEICLIVCLEKMLCSLIIFHTSVFPSLSFSHLFLLFLFLDGPQRRQLFFNFLFSPSRFSRFIKNAVRECDTTARKHDDDEH